MADFSIGRFVTYATIAGGITTGAYYLQGRGPGQDPPRIEPRPMELPVDGVAADRAELLPPERQPAAPDATRQVLTPRSSQPAGPAIASSSGFADMRHEPDGSLSFTTSMVTQNVLNDAASGGALADGTLSQAEAKMSPGIYGGLLQAVVAASGGEPVTAQQIARYVANADTSRDGYFQKVETEGLMEAGMAFPSPLMTRYQQLAQADPRHQFGLDRA